MENVINALSDLLWGQLVYALLAVGIFFTIRTNFIQFRHFGHMFSVLKHSTVSDAAGMKALPLAVDALLGPYRWFTL